jgi:hypothetical protein
MTVITDTTRARTCGNDQDGRAPPQAVNRHHAELNSHHAQFYRHAPQAHRHAPNVALTC